MELENLMSVPVDLIVPNPNQPRKQFSEEGLEELTSSIKEFGVIQPILVHQLSDGTYELIAGERRLRASKLAGLTEIPAVVRSNVYETDSAVMALIENLQRRDLNCFEEAEGYAKLMSEHNMTQLDVAKKVGKNQSTVANKLRLLRLEPEVKEFISEHNLSERHARAILKLPSTEDKLEVLRRVADKDLTVTDTEKLIDLKLKSKMATPSGQDEYSIRGISRDLRLILNEITKIVDTANSLGMKVSMSKENKGRFVEVKLKILS